MFFYFGILAIIGLFGSPIDTLFNKKDRDWDAIGALFVGSGSSGSKSYGLAEQMDDERIFQEAVDLHNDFHDSNNHNW